MRARLAWLVGGFVLVALVVHRLLNRGVQTVEPLPGEAPVAAAPAPAEAAAPAPDAPVEEPPPADVAAAQEVWAAEMAELHEAAGPSEEIDHDALVAELTEGLAAAAADPGPAADDPAAGTAPAGDAGEDEDEDDDVAEGDPDERIEALRRKLEEARSGSAPGEPPLDDRRRSVHDAGRAALDAMRRAAERPPRGSDPA